jgi:hypothetical protein
MQKNEGRKTHFALFIYPWTVPIQPSRTRPHLNSPLNLVPDLVADEVTPADDLSELEDTVRLEALYSRGGIRVGLPRRNEAVVRRGVMGERREEQSSHSSARR